MVYFNNTELELWDYSESAITDVYGDKLPVYTKQSTIKADLQSLSPSETVSIFGEVITDTYKVYLPIGTTINNKMKIKEVSTGKTFDIVGSPIINNHKVVEHIKIILKQERKNLYLNGV